MLDALNALYAKGPSSEAVGICSNVNHYLYLDSRSADDEDWLPLLWASWPEWSGDDKYPVPPYRASESHAGAQQAYNLTSDLWDRGTEYGQLRWELLEHCIKTLQEAIEHANQD